MAEEEQWVELHHADLGLDRSGSRGVRRAAPVRRRRLLAGEGRWVWVAFAPTLVIFGALFVNMAQLLPTAPLLAIPGGLLSALLLGVTVRAFWRAQRSVRPGQFEGNFGAVMDAMSEPMLVAGMVTMLIAVMIGVIGLLVWAILTGGRMSGPGALASLPADRSATDGERAGPMRGYRAALGARRLSRCTVAVCSV